MDESDFFAEQLRVTANQFIWAARQIPEARRYVAPEGRWCAARIIFHITNYERLISRAQHVSVGWRPGRGRLPTRR